MASSSNPRPAWRIGARPAAWLQPGELLRLACKYGGIEDEDAKRLKELISQNALLKQLLAEAHLDIEALNVGFGVKR